MRKPTCSSTPTASPDAPHRIAPPTSSTDLLHGTVNAPPQTTENPRQADLHIRHDHAVDPVHRRVHLFAHYPGDGRAQAHRAGLGAGHAGAGRSPRAAWRVPHLRTGADCARRRSGSDGRLLQPHAEGAHRSGEEPGDHRTGDAGADAAADVCRGEEKTGRLPAEQYRDGRCAAVGRRRRRAGHLRHAVAAAAARTVRMHRGADRLQRHAAEPGNEHHQRAAVAHQAVDPEPAGVGHCRCVQHRLAALARHRAAARCGTAAVAGDRPRRAGQCGASPFQRRDRPADGRYAGHAWPHPRGDRRAEPDGAAPRAAIAWTRPPSPATTAAWSRPATTWSPRTWR